jgi:N5-(cytidine 5'-diphosphoramidyl)-L-glutamine hydrolase
MAEGDQVIRIGVTQRVEVFASYGERRDCLDQRWSELLGSAGLLPVPLANYYSEPENLLENLHCAGFILSGGNDLSFLADAKDPAPERDRLEQALLDYAYRNRLPLLGVCRGMQHMNYYLGGDLEDLEGHVAMKHAVSVEPSVAILGNFLEVNSYHTRGISETGLADALQAAVYAADGSVEAFVHKTLPWVGIMWHPEREESFNKLDLELLSTLFKEGWRR